MHLKPLKERYGIPVAAMADSNACFSAIPWHSGPADVQELPYMEFF